MVPLLESRRFLDKHSANERLKDPPRRWVVVWTAHMKSKMAWLAIECQLFDVDHVFVCHLPFLAMIPRVQWPRDCCREYGQNSHE